MSKTEILAAINQHHHTIDGTGYGFKVAWAAPEPRWSTGSRRYLIAIDVFSEARMRYPRIHIVTHGRTTCFDLLCLVDEALKDHLCGKRRPGAAAHAPDMLHA